MRRWELVEISRKLILVGFLVLVRPGTAVQLVLGCVIALIFLLVQMQSQPFKSKSDNALSVFTNASVFGLLFSCILLRTNELTEFPQVQVLLTGDMRDIFSAPSGFVVATLAGSTLLALVFSVPLLLVALEASRRTMVLRWSKGGDPVEPRRLPGGQFHTFLSHKWSSGQVSHHWAHPPFRLLVGTLSATPLFTLTSPSTDRRHRIRNQDQARSVKALLQELVPGIKVWLDVRAAS